jgi:hypothetical protein
MLEKIIEYLVITIVLGVAAGIIKTSIKKATNGNKEILDIISNDIKSLNDKVTDMKIELANEYLKKTDFNEFKKENINAHTCLREEIRDIEKEYLRGHNVAT